MVEIALCSSNAPMCHGAGIDHQVLGDLVVEMEVINPSGTIVTIKGDELKAAAGCLGLLGPVVSLTFNLPKTQYGKMQPRVAKATDGIPRFETPLDDARVKKFNEDAKKFYSEWFWFTGMTDQSLWINCWDCNGDKNKRENYPSNFTSWGEGLGLVATNAGAELFKNKTEWFTKLFAHFSMLALPKDGEEHVTQVANLIHFARGIQNYHLLNMEWHIGIPKRAGSDEPDFAVARKVWWVIMDRIIAQQAKGDYSVSILEMRLVKGSNMILSPLRATETNKWFVAIEVLGTNVGPNLQPLHDALQDLTDALTAKFELNFHWPKMWNKVGGVDPVTYMKNFINSKVGGKRRIDEFKEVFTTIANRSGLKVSDYKMFSNATLNTIFSELF